VTSALVSVLLPGPFKDRLKAYGAPKHDPRTGERELWDGHLDPS
jgi:hypothetical protein